jgi:hypothetical protein
MTDKVLQLHKTSRAMKSKKSNLNRIEKEVFPDESEDDDDSGPMGNVFSNVVCFCFIV